MLHAHTNLQLTHTIQSINVSHDFYPFCLFVLNCIAFCSTVLGTLLELSESLTTEELQYRMSIQPGQRDTYRKDLSGMMKQLLDHQKRKQHGQSPKR
jgi:hypothetical protein